MESIILRKVTVQPKLAFGKGMRASMEGLSRSCT